MGVYKIGFDSAVDRDNAFATVRSLLKEDGAFATIGTLKRTIAFLGAFFPKDITQDTSEGWTHDDLRFVTSEDVDSFSIKIPSFYVVFPDPHSIKERKTIHVRYTTIDDSGRLEEYTDVKSYELLKNALLLHRDKGEQYIMLDAIDEFMEVRG